MKKNLLALFAAAFVALGAFAQAPQKMSYQAVIRNSSDALITGTQVGMKISILQGTVTGTAVFVETQTPTTNSNGLVSFEIGAGTAVTGTFASINWADGPYFIKTETDPAGGTTYTISGTSQLMSVPYAMHAKTAETVTGGISETDPTFTSSQAVNITAVDINNLANLSGTNTGDQDLSGLATTTALTTGLDGKVDKVTGKGLSTEDYTTAEKTKLAGVATGDLAGQMQYWNGAAWVVVAPGTYNQSLYFCNGVPTWGPCFNDVTNATTGKIWMDRNLGATQVATSSTDVASYGDLYQWGRGTDGHQIRTSGTTTDLSSTDQPGNGNFILAPNSPYDWRSPQNTNLWQGVSGTNNPCPSGYRIPTEAELDAERLSWSANTSVGAFASPLKLPMAGFRSSSNGSLGNVGTFGSYWSSTVSSTNSRYLGFFSSNAGMYTDGRAFGFSVRCLKD
jgi:uncharacterized protein (TIGR02145 family)